MAQLFDQLDSEEFAKREAASTELDYLGKFIKKDLEKVLSDKPSAEVKKRVQALLDRIASESGGAEMPELAGGVRSVSTSTVNGKTTIRINGKELKLTPLPAPTPRLTWYRAERRRRAGTHWHTRSQGGPRIVGRRRGRSAAHQGRQGSARAVEEIISHGERNSSASGMTATTAQPDEFTGANRNRTGRPPAKSVPRSSPDS